MEGPRYLWRQLNSREHVILSKRRTGSKREGGKRSRGGEKETEAVARGRVVHTSNACTRERAGPSQPSRPLICPLLFYTRRSVALRATALDSREPARETLSFPKLSRQATPLFLAFLSRRLSSLRERRTRRQYRVLEPENAVILPWNQRGHASTHVANLIGNRYR